MTDEKLHALSDPKTRSVHSLATHEVNLQATIGEAALACLTESRFIKIIANRSMRDWLIFPDRTVFLDKNVMDNIYKFMTGSSKLDTHAWASIHAVSACCILNHSDLGTLRFDVGPALLEDPQPSYCERERNAVVLFTQLPHEIHLKIIEFNYRWSGSLPIAPGYKPDLSASEVIKPYYYLMLAAYVCIRKNKTSPMEALQEYIQWQHDNTIDLVSLLMVCETLCPSSESGRIMKNHQATTFEKLSAAIYNSAWDSYLVHGARTVAQHERQTGIAICSADKGLLNILDLYRRIKGSPSSFGLNEYFQEKWGSKYIHLLPHLEDRKKLSKTYKVLTPIQIEEKTKNLEMRLKESLARQLSPPMLQSPT